MAIAHPEMTVTDGAAATTGDLLGGVGVPAQFEWTFAVGDDAFVSGRLRDDHTASAVARWFRLETHPAPDREVGGRIGG